jgi:hypothetical protein
MQETPRPGDSDIFLTTQVDGGLIVTEARQTAYYFSYQSQSVVELPNGDQGVYFDAVQDGVLLYGQRETQDERPEGIYRYDVASETFTLLVADGAALGR